MFQPPIARNLMLGALALQRDLITPQAMTAALHTWLMDPVRSLGDLLVEQHALPREQQVVLEGFVDQSPRVFDGRDTPSNTPQGGLASLSTVEQNPFELDAANKAQRDAIEPQDGIPWETLAPHSNRFRALRIHDEGGLGRIFVAHDEELNREVALKEIKEERADDPESRARFYSEAEITGALQHPGVVAVYSLGAYADGRPYYAMPWIRGDNLHAAIHRFHDGDDHARQKSRETGQKSLELRNLLGRFIDVCQTMQYAHDRQVLHRDLKPANIMLGQYGETLVVDWGLAKPPPHPTTASSEIESPVQTSDRCAASPTLTDEIVGTPVYMSPEQAAGDGKLMGPVSDVYSLGVTLYELLTGKHPFEGSTLKELLEAIRLRRFPRPREIIGDVPRPLEAICLKAMAGDPDQRYPSAKDFANDLERWLADEPVAAYPEPVSERARRWVKRHRTVVASAGAGLAMTLVGLAAVLVLLSVSNRQLAGKNTFISRQNQEIQTKNVELEQRRQDAEQAAQAAENVTEFMVSVFRSPNPDADGRKITIAAMLDRALEQLETRLDGTPILRAMMFDALGETYLGLGIPKEATRAFQAARNIYLRHGIHQLDSQAAEVFETYSNNLALAYWQGGKWEDAIDLLEEISKSAAARGREADEDLKQIANLLSLRVAAGQWADIEELEKVLEKSRARLGEDDVVTLALMNNLASHYRDAGKTQQAIAMHEKTLELARGSLGADDRLTLQSMVNLGVVYKDIGRMEEAIELLKSAIERQHQVLGEDHPQRLSAMHNLAVAFYEADRLSDAIVLQKTALSRRRRRLGDEHYDTLSSQASLGEMYSTAGRHQEAIELLSRTLDKQKTLVGENHLRTFSTLDSLATAYRATGNTNEALVLLQEAYPRMKTHLGSDHFQTLESGQKLALTLEVAGRIDQSVSLHEEVLRRARTNLALPPGHVVACMNELGTTYRRTARLEESRRLLEESLTTAQEKLGDQHPTTWISMRETASTYRALGRHDEALALFEKALVRQQEHLGEDHVQTLTTMNNMGLAYEGARRFAEAIALYEKALPLRRKVNGDGHPETLKLMKNLSLAYQAMGQLDKAFEIGQQVVQLCESHLAPNDPETLHSTAYLGTIHIHRGEIDKAEPLLENSLSRMHAVWPKGDPQTHDCANSLAFVYFRTGRMEKALPLLEPVYQSKLSRQGADHPNVSIAGFNLAVLYAAVENHEAALPIFRESVPRMRRADHPHHQHFLRALVAWGRSLLAVNKAADAHPILGEAYDQLKAVQETGLETLEARSLLGAALAMQEQFEEAQHHLVGAAEELTARARTQPHEEKVWRESIERLIEYYENQKQPEKAKEWRKKLKD